MMRILFGCVIGVLALLALAACTPQPGAGQVLKQFTRPCGPPLIYWMPVWSSDGEHIAVYSTGGQTELDILSPTGQVLVMSPMNSVGALDHPSWSPEGGRLAVVYLYHLSVIRSDGSSLTDLDPHGDLGIVTVPAWSPDGKQILFVSTHKNMAMSLGVINVDGTGHLDLADTLNGPMTAPTWSPDAKQILFAQVNDQNQNALAVINPDGSGLKQLTGYEPYIGGMSWSPDGKQIAFSVGASSTVANIFVIDSDGSNARQITSYTTEAAFGPQWSPDGKLIAYWGVGQGGASTIDVMKPDGSAITVLAKQWSGGFSWSPDSTRIAYSDTLITKDVYVVTVDGGRTIQLTHNPANQTCLRWPF